MTEKNCTMSTVKLTTFYLPNISSFEVTTYLEIKTGFKTLQFQVVEI